MQFKSTKACGFVLLKTKMSTKRTKEPSFVLLENRYHHQTWHQADLPMPLQGIELARRIHPGKTGNRPQHF